jgi:hypothetical protein
VDAVLDIVENVSFSKQKTGKRKLVNPELQKYLDIVSDADRLESLGDEGIWRALVFTLACKKNEPTKEVFRVYRERQLPLFPEFIVTRAAIVIAKERYNRIAAFVEHYADLADSVELDPLIEAVSVYCNIPIQKLFSFLVR